MNYWDIFDWITFSILTFLLVLLLYSAILSYFEKEQKAMIRSLQIIFLFVLPFIIIAFYDFGINAIVNVIIILPTAVLTFLVILPLNKYPRIKRPVPAGKIDERDIMFSRRRLEPGTKRFETYYEMRPENKEPDEKFRKQPGLLNSQAQFYDPLAFAAADASFTTVEMFHGMVETPLAEREPIELNPGKASEFVKHWGIKLGAVNVGITNLRDYHLYSHIGRGEPYGAKIDLDHKYAIAFTVEMDKKMLDFAPSGPTVMESAQQYLNAGAIAVQLAQWIKNLGYPARAHIDGNYRVVCPLVARDAGLGEIGRMGLLMTPELGPRVRLGVVTTDLPLQVDRRKAYDYMLDFCEICKKCADVCPSKAISSDSREEINGVKRWQIDQAACYTYWCKAGTDCGRCVRVCPFSHPDNFLHNVVRFGVKHSWFFRRLALKLDDLFYGRKPPPTQPLRWLNSNKH